MNKVKVKDSTSLYRDTDSGAIINCYDTEYDSYITLKQQKLKEVVDLETQKKDIDNLKNEITEIKDMLRSLVNGN